MKIVNVGYDYRHGSDFCINRPCGSGDCILLVLKSPAYFVFDGVRNDVSGGGIVVFKKGTPQMYGATCGEFVNDWIHFEMDETEEGAMRELGIPFDKVIEVDDTTPFSGYIKSMFDEKYSQNIYKERTLELYFELILTKLSERINMPQREKDSPYYYALSALRNDIYNNPGKERSIDGISKEMHLSCSYVQHLYKAFFGKSIVHDITNSRMEYAKYLLSSTDMTVGSISGLCGYNNDVHFMRMFKKATGVTPSDFRTQMHIAVSEVEKSRKSNPFCL